MDSKSPVHKRIKLDPSPSPSPAPQADSSGQGEIVAAMEVEEDEDTDHCVICLHHVRDRTVLPCAHDRLCFECIIVWTAQSRKCPLCNAPIGPFLIHNVRSKYDYQKYYLPPLRTSPPPDNVPTHELPLRRGNGSTSRTRGRGRTTHWGTRTRNRSTSREREEIEDELQLAVERRRWVYRHGLYAKHVASNPFTRYRPAPTPAQISSSPDLISRATIFVRRELRVWVNLDVEFLTTFILSLMKSLDLRSESSVKLLAEFLDMDTPYHVGDPSERSEGRFKNAEQFAHELYSYLRSPFRDLATYDSAVQYDVATHVPPAPEPITEPRRWDLSATRPALRSRSRHPSPSPISPSPRDAYSRSLSPVRSLPLHERHELRRSSPSPGSADRVAPSETLTKHTVNSSPYEEDCANGKRKGKGPLRPDVDVERYLRRDGDRTRSQPDSGSRGHSSSAGRSEIHLTYHRSPSDALEESRRRSPPAASGFEQENSMTGRNYRSAARMISRSPARVSETNNTKDANEPPNSNPAILDATWGISIKGQAKQLSGSLELYDPRPDPDDPNRASATLRKRTRHISSLDVLHAHLGHVSLKSGSSAKSAAVSDPAKAVKGDQRDAPAQGDAVGDDSLSVHSDADTHRTSLLFHPRDLLPSETGRSQSQTMTQTSAPVIMARTRAKLTKMRSQVVSHTPEVADLTLEPPLSPIPTSEASGGPSSNPNLRARLIQRLEEERRTASKLHDVPHAPQDAWLNSWDLQVAQMAPSDGADTHEGGAPTGVSLESQEAEIRVRAQALLRVRLAAEKRKAGPPLEVMSKEQALKAQLLSRLP